MAVHHCPPLCQSRHRIYFCRADVCEYTALILSYIWEMACAKKKNKQPCLALTFGFYSNKDRWHINQLIYLISIQLRQLEQNLTAFLQPRDYSISHIVYLLDRTALTSVRYVCILLHFNCFVFSNCHSVFWVLYKDIKLRSDCQPESDF